VPEIALSQTPAAASSRGATRPSSQPSASSLPRAPAARRPPNV